MSINSIDKLIDNSINYLTKNDAIFYLQKIGADLDKKKRTIIFHDGEFRINKSLELPKNRELKFKAGSKIIIESGITIKINGPVNFVGEKENPVKDLLKAQWYLNKLIEDMTDDG